jgi:glutamate/tyrosine decarboxylase-like PLP-dependent enzyme
VTTDPRPELTAAVDAARRWLAGVASRPIPATTDAAAVGEALGTAFPRTGTAPAEVVERLIGAVEPGLLAIGSPRFYGWVMGGTLPAALAADWLVSAWDQNAGMRGATPGVVGAEDLAARWLLEALGLPQGAGVGFVTGATMANATGLAAARDAVLDAAGWDVESRGLVGAPRVRVLAGAERHGSIDLSLRYLGLGAPDLVAVDDEGRIDPGSLAAALSDGSGPTIVCAQAGNIHSGAFDPLPEVVAAARAHRAGVHVDGAFGLWAAVSPRTEHLTRGLAGADSWATDAHKTLNTPYDCGIAIVREPVAMRRAFGQSAAYLLHSDAPDPHELVPEMSRRARGVPVWAALASLGSDGLTALVDGLVAAARAIADGLRGIRGVEVLHDVVYTQVTVAVGDDERTQRVLDRLLAEGVVRPSASRWHDRGVIRFSVSNHGTDPAAVADTVAAVERAVRAEPAAAEE